MFEEQFLALTRKVEVIDTSASDADEAKRAELIEKLSSIRDLGVAWLDQWMALEEKISDVFDKLHTVRPHSRTGLDSTIRVRFSPEPQQVQLESAIFDMANHTEVSLRKGLAYFELYMYEEAVIALEKVVQNHESQEAAVFLAASYAAMDKLDDAQEQIDFIKENTNNPRLVCAGSEVEAYIHLRKGNLEGAIRAYLDALFAMPVYSDVWFNLGACYLSANDGVAAERMLAHFLKTNENDREAILLYICSLVHQGRIHDAFEQCTKSYRLFPDYLDLQVVYSYICQLSGKMKLGERISLRLMKEYPHNIQGYLHSSWYALARGDYEKSNVILKKSLSVVPNHPVALLQLAAAQLLSPMQTEPIEMVSLTQLEPQFADLMSIISGLMELKSQSHSMIQSDDCFAMATQSKNPFIRRLAAYIFGMYMMKHEQFSEALRYFHIANASGPPNYAILVALHQAASILGRTEEAKIFLEQASLARDKDLLKCN